VIRLAFDGATANAILAHVRGNAPDEEGAFCLLRQGRGSEGTRLLATRALLPREEDWESRKIDQLRPKAQWISQMVSEAISSKAGLLFVHSHPDLRHPVGLSAVDESAFTSLARTIAPMLDGPFAALVIHPAGWSGVVWQDERLIRLDRVYALARTLRWLSPRLAQPISQIDLRQRDALGSIHQELQDLDVGVVGCGGIGSPLAEELARMGVRSIRLVDLDVLDTPSNVRRVFGSSGADLQAAVPPAKVDIVGRHIDRLVLGVPVRRVHGDVRAESVFRSLLDTDVVLCGTDTHGSRAIVNELASTYFLPVIDVGVRVGSRAEAVLCGLLAEIRVLTPTTLCLWCRQIIDADVIRAENLPDEERTKLAREGYVSGSVGAPAPSVTALTVFASGMAGCALLGLLSEDVSDVPSAYWFDGLMGDAGALNLQEPVAGCICRKHFGLGDMASIPFVPDPATVGH
jgi:hypothetical protein